MKTMLLAMLLICSSSWAQFGLIEGRVIKQVDGQPKPFVVLGTACLVSPTIVLTCHHTSQGKNLSVTFGNQRIPADLVVADDQRDIAIVRLRRSPRGVKPVTVAVAHLNEPVTIGGWAGDSRKWKYQKGIISARGINPNGGLATVISGVLPRSGDSGGPVLDRRGNLVGIVFAMNMKFVGPEGTPDEDLVLDEENSEAWVHEFIAFLNEHLPNNKLWSDYKHVSPYREVIHGLIHKMEINQWKQREEELEKYIQENLLPVPAGPLGLGE